MKKPNIIFFFTDQQRWDSIGAYGQKLNITPNIDKMAAEGTIFENAFSCQPVCGPARACLQTGMYSTQTGNFVNDCALPKDKPLLARLVRNQEYETSYIGKWHLASDRRTGSFFHDKPVPPELRGGYDDYWLASDALEHTSHGYGGYMFNGDMNRVDFEGYRVDALTDYAIDYIKTRSMEKPFYLMLSFLEPHHQNDHGCYEGPEGSKEKFKEYEIPGDLTGTEGDWRENYPDYLGCCNSLDYNLGRIFSALDEKGIYDNTIIIYSSDHGSHFRTRNREYKRSGHENSIRVPLIAWGADFMTGKKVKELVSILDIPPTILKITDGDIPDKWQGRPLQNLINGDNLWRKEIFVQTSEDKISRIIRTKKWKYSISRPMDFVSLQNADKESAEFEEEFLYHLENDPHERNNLVYKPEYNFIKIDLQKKLIANMIAAGEKKPLIKKRLPPQ